MIVGDDKRPVAKDRRGVREVKLPRRTIGRPRRALNPGNRRHAAGRHHHLADRMVVAHVHDLTSDIKAQRIELREPCSGADPIVCPGCGVSCYRCDTSARDHTNRGQLAVVEVAEGVQLHHRIVLSRKRRLRECAVNDRPNTRAPSHRRHHLGCPSGREACRQR